MIQLANSVLTLESQKKKSTTQGQTLRKVLDKQLHVQDRWDADATFVVTCSTLTSLVFKANCASMHISRRHRVGPSPFWSGF